MERLRQLTRFGLAHERQTGVWEIAADTEPRLKALGRRSDIINTMHRAMREARIDRPAGSFALFAPEKLNAYIVGQVVGVGLTDEISDRHRVIIYGTDGKAHYADVGSLPPDRLPEKGMIVSIEARHEAEEHRSRVRLRILSYLSLEKLVTAEGATWLDRELLSRKSEPLLDQERKAPWHVAGRGSCRRSWRG